MFDKIRIPKYREPLPPAPDIREILATPDPGLFETVRKHAAEAGVDIVVEGEGLLANKLRKEIERHD